VNIPDEKKNESPLRQDTLEDLAATAKDASEQALV